MKKLLMVFAAVLLVCGIAAAAETEKKAEGEKGKAEKKLLMNFAKGDEFNNGGECSLSEEHITGKEKYRMKVIGSTGVNGARKNVDWSKFNYLVFNAFVAGDKPITGMLLIGDKSSYAKWSRNYVEINLTLKPGENKDVHINIEGLYSSYASRALEMTNIQCFQFYFGDQKPEIYFGNLYLAYEEE